MCVCICRLQTDTAAAGGGTGGGHTEQAFSLHGSCEPSWTCAAQVVSRIVGFGVFTGSSSNVMCPCDRARLLLCEAVALQDAEEGPLAAAAPSFCR